MKYRDTVMKILDSGWKSTSHIRKEVEKKEKKTINWYTVNYLLEGLLKEGKVEKAESNRVTLWKKK